MLWIVVTFGLIFMMLKCTAQEYEYFTDEAPAKAYAEEFMRDAQLYNASLYRTGTPVLQYSDYDLFATVNGKSTQVLAYTTYSTNTIVFDTRSSMYEYNLKVLVYHELGHYYLNRDHTNTRSIMNYNIWATPWEDYSPIEQSYFIEELFK